MRRSHAVSIAARLGVVLVPVSLTACSDECTMASSSSMVTVELPNQSRRLADFCVDDQSVAPTEDVVVASQPAEYEYRLTVLDPNGVATSQDGIVKTAYFFINGLDCDLAPPT